ncbi:hypothetical protein Barb7_01216 [Bacteroidales bacterium Barb7]|nr:hypothetical protein Barb7_01216 [Bacteroidales bacterium Barb7]
MPNIQFIKNAISFFQNFSNAVVPITPHSATLHVGLKSFALSGLLRKSLLSL